MLFSQKLQGLQPCNLGHAYIRRGAARIYDQYGVLIYFLRFTNFVNFCRVFACWSFLRNYKGESHETWVMHASGGVQLKAMINAVS